MRDVVGARRDRAWGIVSDCLAASLYGASTMAVMDRLLRAGYDLDEARQVLQELREAKLVSFEAGHWVLQGGTVGGGGPERASGPQKSFVSWQ